MRITILGLCAMLTASLWSIQSATAQQRWDLAAAYPAGNHHTQFLEAFAERVNERSVGAVTITVHPNGSLFPGNQIKRAVQTGQTDMGERLVSALGNENPIFEVDAVPFLATSFDESWILYQITREYYQDILAAQNIQYLYALPWPPQGLFTATAVERAEDMQGRRFRAYNVATSRIAELFQAQPTQIEAAELSQALATGVVDSMFTSGATGVDSKVWEQLDYYYDVRAWIPLNIVMINQRVWNGLDADTQEILLDVAAEIEAEGWEHVRGMTAGLNATLAENGMQVLEPSAALSEGLREMGEILTAEWIERAGDTGQAIIDAFQAAR